MAMSITAPSEKAPHLQPVVCSDEEQALRLIHVQPGDVHQLRRHIGKDPRQRHAAYAARHRHHGLHSDAVQNDIRDKHGKGHDSHGGGDCGPAPLHQKRDQQEEHKGYGDAETQQRLEPLLTPHQHQNQGKEAYKAPDQEIPGVVIDAEGVHALFNGIDGDGDLVPHRRVHVVHGAEVVCDLLDLSGVAACEDLHA